MTFTIFTKKPAVRIQEELSWEESFTREWDSRRDMATTQSEREEIDAIFSRYTQTSH